MHVKHLVSSLVQQVILSGLILIYAHIYANLWQQMIMRQAAKSKLNGLFMEKRCVCGGEFHWMSSKIQNIGATIPGKWSFVTIEIQ